MLYCPYCGIIVKNEENYCLNCGKQLPKDIDKRFNFKRRFNRLWYIPLSIFVLFILATVPFYLFLQQQNIRAKEFYDLGEKNVLNKEYEQAKKSFEESLSYKDDFYEAEISLSFVNHMIEIEQRLLEVENHLEQYNFKEALLLTNEAENLIKNYHGAVVTDVINNILMLRNKINISSITEQLKNKPSINTLKNLLWEAEALNTVDAEELADYIRNEIIDYTFSKASEQLNNKQFNDAKLLVEDGLKYATNSEKLKSLRSAIDKEKTAFEMDEQQRIEQAIHMAEEEREHNESSAIKLKNITIKKDKQNRFVVSGQVLSVATIPIHSILIEYTLIYRDSKIAENKIFVYPETLYPDETGKFEFTHYEINHNFDDITVNVDKIKWYID